MEWMLKNWQWLGPVVFGVSTLAAVIVKKTANDTDDGVWAVVLKVLVVLGFVSQKDDGSLGIGVPFFKNK